VPHPRYGILGTLTVHAGSEPVAVTTTQLRRFLCILLLSQGRPVSATAISDCIWPDGDEIALADRPKDPLATVRVYASRLRRLLPEEAGPHADARGYRLDFNRDDLDADRFEEFLAAGSSLLPDSPGPAATALREGLNLWRGEALAEFRDERWALSTAVRLDELKLAALERLHDARLALGEHQELCGDVEALLEDHPLRERLWAQLILALYRSGRQADALRAYQRLRELLVEELGIEPSRELSELESAVLRQDAGLDLRGRLGPGSVVTGLQDGRRSLEIALATQVPDRSLVPTNLPAQVTSFIGRQKETAAVLSLLVNFRIVTLTGPGGTGKSRLACEVAEILLDDPVARDERAGGVFLVELAAVRDPLQVASTVAVALGMQPPPGTPVIDALLEALRGAHVQLIIDNCEHLVEACAELCDALVQSCRGVRVLATSREPLGIEGEVIYRVPPLGLPDQDVTDTASIAAEEAVRLFMERARVHQPSLQLDDSNARLVASLCRRLDGIPLALELAAPRLRALSLSQINNRLDQRFRLLVGGSRSRLPRQQTMAALIDWSYDLLSDRERSVFRRLAVFAGTFDLDLAGAVLADEEQDEWAVAESVTSLVDKSLVVADWTGDGTRLRLLDTIRAYAHDHLVAEEGRQVLEALRGRHAAVYLELAERAAPMIATPEQFDWLDRLDIEFDNFRAALTYFISTPSGLRQACRMVVAGARFCAWRGHERDLLLAIEALSSRQELSEPEPDPLMARVLLTFLKILGQADPAQATSRLEDVLEVARGLGDDGLVAEVLNRLAWFALSTGDRSRSRALHDGAVDAARKGGEYLPLMMALNGGCAPKEDQAEALALATVRNDAIGRYMVLSHLASDALDAGDPKAARAYFEEALPIIERASPGGDANLFVSLADTRLLDGDHASARDLYSRGLETARRYIDERHATYAIVGLAACAEALGESILGATLLGVVERELAESGFALEEVDRRIRAESESRLRASLGDEAFEAARAVGRSLDRDQATEIALGRRQLASVTA
jgi:predicted ATPase/DNA-binding SARP family transcriptional activator